MSLSVPYLGNTILGSWDMIQLDVIWHKGISVIEKYFLLVEGNWIIFLAPEEKVKFYEYMNN